MNFYETVAQMEALSPTGSVLGFCEDTNRFYVYSASSGATRDGVNVLNTALGGTTRWLATLNYGTAKLDDATQAIITVPYEHHEAHEGESFYYHDVIALGNAGVQNYLITTPNTTRWGHFGYQVEFCDARGILEVYESAVRTGTTAQTILNRNRNSATTATITVHKDYSGGSSDGSRIVWKSVCANRNLSASVGSGLERILKQNTKYIFRLTNTSATTNNANVELDWYEHTNIA